MNVALSLCVFLCYGPQNWPVCVFSVKFNANSAENRLKFPCKHIYVDYVGPSDVTTRLNITLGPKQFTRDEVLHSLSLFALCCIS